MPLLNHFDVARVRLHNQQIVQPTFTQPDEVVQWLGAVQAQEYPGAAWALSLRTSGTTHTAIDQALADGRILRTHVMRPTWHFVVPADIRWLLELTAPRVNANNAHRYRQLELDDTVFARSVAVFERVLQDGAQLTRVELGAALQQAGIEATGPRLAHLVMHAELDGVLCSGAKRGKQFTYALLAERAPNARTLERDAALAELSQRYVASHGPATLADYVWWSGLTVADARAGLAMAQPVLLREVIEGQTYWYADAQPAPPTQSPTATLIPTYDEFVVGYTDRRAIIDARYTDAMKPRDNIVFSPTIVIDGQIVGTWQRTVRQHSVEVELKPFAPLPPAEHAAVVAAAQRYGAFVQKPVVLG